MSQRLDSDNPASVLCCLRAPKPETNKVMLGSHVDDLLFACKPGHEHFVTKIKKAFDVDDSKSLPTRIFVLVVVKFHKTKKEISK